MHGSAGAGAATSASALGTRSLAGVASHPLDGMASHPLPPGRVPAGGRATSASAASRLSAAAAAAVAAGTAIAAAAGGNGDGGEGMGDWEVTVDLDLSKLLAEDPDTESSHGHAGPGTSGDNSGEEEGDGGSRVVREERYDPGCRVGLRGPAQERCEADEPAVYGVGGVGGMSSVDALEKQELTTPRDADGGSRAASTRRGPHRDPAASLQRPAQLSTLDAAAEAGLWAAAQDHLAAHTLRQQRATTHAHLPPHPVRLHQQQPLGAHTSTPAPVPLPSPSPESTPSSAGFGTPATPLTPAGGVAAAGSKRPTSDAATHSTADALDHQWWPMRRAPKRLPARSLPNLKPSAKP
eukprot:365794-Chlamydomonas_euryale.AAC.1